MSYVVEKLSRKTLKDGAQMSGMWLRMREMAFSVVSGQGSVISILTTETAP